MSKVLIIGDCHWGNRSNSPIFYEYFSKFYKHLIEYIDFNQIDTIIQLGDLLDSRRQVNYLTLFEMKRMFLRPLQERNVKLYVISGNHDCYYKNTNAVNSVQLLQTSNMVVIDQVPQTDSIGCGVDVDFYPWINETNLAESLNKAESTKSKYAFGHFEFANFRLHKNQIADSGMDHHIMKNYGRVFSGHYHTISRRDNVLYTGTPYELDWADHNDTKGFWILNTVTDHIEFVKTPFRLYEKIEYDENYNEFDFDMYTDKYIKVIIKNKTNQYTFDSFFNKLLSMKPYDVQIIDDEVARAIETVMGTDIKVQTTSDMIRFVVDSMKTNLDKNKLKKMIGDVYLDATEMLKI
jgi:DNA repair exonuclease SbcCD nuclease subunit